MNRVIRCALSIGAAWLLLSSAHAQTRFSDPQKTLDEEFWGKLYKDGGKTFFCNKEFSKKSILLTESYVYSTSWIRDHLRCGTPRQCRENDQNYRRITSDLHNIFPADARIELERRNAKFEELPGSISADSCGLKRSFQTIEPADNRKGDIARIIFYMSQTYDLPVVGDINQLKRWHQADPPTAEEQARNQKILDLQGNENRYISNPSAVDSLDGQL